VAFTQEGWQQLLDLLEQRTGTAYDDLWSAWVVNPSQDAQLAVRATTREGYFATVEAAGDWELPEAIRYDLGSWQFAEVNDELETANRVLDLAADLATLAGDLDLEPSGQLQATFEGTSGLDAALTEANKELFSLELIADATRELNVEPKPVERIGLLFAEPSIDLAAAREAWEAGRHGDATDHAEAVLAILDAADDLGRERLAIGAGVLIVTVGGAALILRRRRAAARPPTPQPPEPAESSFEEAA
jgi:hypothetical protein